MIQVYEFSLGQMIYVDVMHVSFVEGLHVVQPLVQLSDSRTLTAIRLQGKCLHNRKIGPRRKPHYTPRTEQVETSATLPRTEASRTTQPGITRSTAHDAPWELVHS
jgi:hypothetical protein